MPHRESRNDYFALHRIDSSGLTTSEKQTVNDWFQKQKPRECSISLRSVETQEGYEAFYEVCKPTLKNICVLWEDEESNYAGICTHGIMKGMIMFISHDFLFPIPTFRNIETFLQTVEQETISDLFPPQVAFIDDKHNPFDYPSKHKTSEQQKQDELIADVLWKEADAANGVDKKVLLYAFLQIASPNQLSRLKPYLFDDAITYHILCIYKYYGYREAPDLLLQIGREKKHFRKLLKELGASPKKILGIEKW